MWRAMYGMCGRPCGDVYAMGSMQWCACNVVQPVYAISLLAVNELQPIGFHTMAGMQLSACSVDIQWGITG